MEVIILNGQKMISAGATHEYLREQMNFPAYYGNNLDALWDMLTTISKPSYVRLLEAGVMRKNLGEYADSILSVFREAAEENACLAFEIEEKT